MVTPIVEVESEKIQFFPIFNFLGHRFSTGSVDTSFYGLNLSASSRQSIWVVNRSSPTQIEGTLTTWPTRTNGSMVLVTKGGDGSVEVSMRSHF